ncbi:hypothetical protein L9F63_011911 [Diploptera punctata]|uniref:Uncharacterized protein n=1 Tax=Diploptera punctata TaxID=6984 RepID=A0AAD8EPL1_DIPPU|nr:hypothetical protein L9F63_011911 [Diploptera punctata]
MPKLELDLQYLCDAKNKAEIERNIKNRKGVGNINQVLKLYNELQKDTVSEEGKTELMDEFLNEACQIPNKSSPEIIHYGSKPQVINVTGTKRSFNFKPKEFSNITTKLNLMRTENLSNLSGHKSYYFMGQLAELEQCSNKIHGSEITCKKFSVGFSS